MITVLPEVAEALNSDTRQFDAKLFVGETEIECDVMHIKFYKGACGQFTVGTIYVPYIEITIDGSFKIENEFVLKMAAKVGDEYPEYSPIGKFKPTYYEDSKVQTIIYAQGKIAETANKPLFETEPDDRYLTDIKDAIEAKGYPITIKNGLVIPTARINEFKPLAGFTVRDGIELLVTCCGGYATEDNQGNICLCKFANTEPALEIEPHRLHEEPKVKGEYVLTGITVTVNESEIYQIPDKESEKNIQITNPYFTAEMVNAFTQNTIGYRFHVISMPVALGDYRLEPWDYVSFFDGDLGLLPSNELLPNEGLTPQDVKGRAYNIPCLTLEFDFDGGLQNTITSDGQLPEEVNTKTGGPITTQLQSIYDTAIGAHDLAEQAEAIATGEIEGVASSYTKIYYAAGTQTTYPTPGLDGWTETIPELSTLKPYLWMRVVTISRTYNEETETYTETIEDLGTPVVTILMKGVYTFIDGAADGSTVINGGCIRTGKIITDVLDVDDIMARAVRVGGYNSNDYILIDEASIGLIGTETQLTLASGSMRLSYNDEEVVVISSKNSTTTTKTDTTTRNISRGNSITLSPPENWINTIVTFSYVLPSGAKKHASFGAKYNKSVVWSDGGYSLTLDGRNGLKLTNTSSATGSTITIIAIVYTYTTTRVEMFNLNSGAIIMTADGSITGEGAVTGKNIYTNSELRWKESLPSSAGSSRDNGTLHCMTAGIGGYYVGFVSSSKYVKNSIKDIQKFDCKKLYDIPVRQYVYNEDEDTEITLGLIADEVAEHFPVAAIYRKDFREGKDPADWSERIMIPAMLKLIQEQHNEIEELKQRVYEMEKTNGISKDNLE